MAVSLESRTILGPLTTTFTPPPSCSIIYSQSVFLSSWSPNFQRGAVCTAIPANGDAGVYFDPSCYPSATAPTQDVMAGFPYSPGFICPAGYSTACMAAKLSNGLPSTIPQGTSFDFPVSLRAAETAVGFCPRCVSL